MQPVVLIVLRIIGCMSNAMTTAVAHDGEKHAVIVYQCDFRGAENLGSKRRSDTPSVFVSECFHYVVPCSYVTSLSRNYHASAQLLGVHVKRKVIIILN